MNCGTQFVGCREASSSLVARLRRFLLKSGGNPQRFPPETPPSLRSVEISLSEVGRTRFGRLCPEERAILYINIDIMPDNTGIGCEMEPCGLFLDVPIRMDGDVYFGLKRCEHSRTREAESLFGKLLPTAFSPWRSWAAMDCSFFIK